MKSDFVHPLTWSFTGSFTGQLGLEIVQVECLGDLGQDTFWEDPGSPRTIAIHRDLLYRYSRKFLEPLRSVFETRIVKDCLERAINDENRHDPHEIAPVGYIPTGRASMAEWGLSAGEQPNTEAKTVTHTTLQIDESPFIFEMFVQWAYSQELKLDRFGPAEDKYCAALYGLAERLDIPDLRQQCFRHFWDFYEDEKYVPDVSVAEVIIKHCSKTSCLRVCFLDHICGCMMVGKIKLLCEPILDLEGDFASEVANQLLNNLRDASSANNYWDSDADDSDSEYFLSEEDDLESAYENSDEIMSDSESDGSDTEEGDDDMEEGEQRPRSESQGRPGRGRRCYAAGRGCD